MLVTDHSGSMAANDVQPTRLAAAIRAANTFIDQLPRSVRVGAIGFSSSPDAVQQPVTNHAAARAIIDGAVGRRRDRHRRRAAARAAAPARQRAQAPAGGDRAALRRRGQRGAGSGQRRPRQAARDRIPIYTVALGTPDGVLSNPDPFGAPVPVPPDPQLMQQIAQVSGARAFNAQTADQLSSIYKHLGQPAGHGQPQARDHGRVRDRGAGGAAGGGGGIGALVGPAAVRTEPRPEDRAQARVARAGPILRSSSDEHGSLAGA